MCVFYVLNLGSFKMRQYKNSSDKLVIDIIIFMSLYNCAIDILILKYNDFIIIIIIIHFHSSHVTFLPKFVTA